MKKLVLSSEQVAGLFIGTLGLAVALHWLFQSARIASLIPGSAMMGINTPILFMAAGFCCFFALGKHRRAGLIDIAWTVCAAWLVILPLLVLSEHLFDVELGIDFLRVPTAPTPTIPHPGRMAPNTCVGFLLAGIALSLMRWQSGALQGRRLRQALITGCAAAVTAIGLGAMAGYFLKLEGLYRLTAFNAMVAPTAIGMTVLGLGLWATRMSLLTRAGSAPVNSEERITSRAITVVTVVALSAGAAGFAVMRDSYEDSITQNMRVSAASAAATLDHALETSLWFTRTVAGRPTVRGAMLTLARAPGDPAAREALARFGASFADGGISAVAFEANDGTLLASSGPFVHARASSRHPLAVAGQTAQLVWDKGYVLYTKNLVREDGRVLGAMIAEQRMPVIDQLLAGIRSTTDSSDVLVCNRDGDVAACAPTRFYPEPLRIPMFKADGSVNLPINHALLGRSGVMVTKDLRGVPVFAAYMPLGFYELGIVVKSDVETLYTPLKTRANVLVLALVALVVLGASMLLVQVRPLLQQLVREQRRNRVILENSNDAFVALGPDGRITDWNTEAERTFGWSPAEAIGRPLTELIVPPAQRAAHDAGFARFVKTGTGPVINNRLEVTAIRRDGSEIPIEMSVAALFTGEGYVANAFVRDITERRRLGQEIAARATELEHERDRAQAANRAKSEFVANMSHELRTPMNAVLGITYLLGHTELKPEQREYLEMIRSSGQSLLDIMNAILDFSKIEAGRMELDEGRFHLGDVLGAVATIMSVNAGEKDLELAIGVEPDVPQLLFGDALRLQQVLVNLAGNAIKFTERGEVSVLVGLAGRSAGKVTLRILVRDTGIGMDPDQQARLFSPFTQGDTSTTRRFGGTGLGLTISKRLVELMGGTIELDSAVGQGSCFRISVPLREDDEPGELRRPEAALGRLRILIVDDNQTSRDYLAMTVAGWRWSSDCAGSGAEAIAMLARAESEGSRYDVVLLDWQMPGMDGASTIRALRELVPAARLPITLMVNAYGRGRLMESPTASQVDAILSKPVTGSSLFDTLHEILVQRARGGDASVYEAPIAATVRLDGARLLLAEDNELNQAVARGILERVGARIDIVPNGALAVARLEAEPQGYDLVLMDIQMPVMDGYAATRRIRSELGLTLPILAMTAGVTESERSECVAAGMDGLIAKPIEVDDMLGTLARHLPSLRRNGPPPAPVAAPAPAPEAQELPVLRIEPLVTIARGNAEHLTALARLVQRMVDQGTTEFDQAERLWRDGRADEAARLLHSLRGGVGSIGAKRFAAASLALEQAIKGGERALAGTLFARARGDIEAVMVAARAWLDEHAAQEG